MQLLHFIFLFYKSFLNNLKMVQGYILCTSVMYVFVKCYEICF